MTYIPRFPSEAVANAAKANATAHTAVMSTQCDVDMLQRNLNGAESRARREAVDAGQASR